MGLPEEPPGEGSFDGASPAPSTIGDCSLTPSRASRQHRVEGDSKRAGGAGGTGVYSNGISDDSVQGCAYPSFPEAARLAATLDRSQCRPGFSSPGRLTHMPVSAAERLSCSQTVRG